MSLASRQATPWSRATAFGSGATDAARSGHSARGTSAACWLRFGGASNAVCAVPDDGCGWRRCGRVTGRWLALHPFRGLIHRGVGNSTSWERLSVAEIVSV
jgi:hypothetical protein